MAINDITGDNIINKISNDYRNNYDEIFRKGKKKNDTVDKNEEDKENETEQNNDND